MTDSLYDEASGPTRGLDLDWQDQDAGILDLGGFHLVGLDDQALEDATWAVLAESLGL